jgi:iron complex transport system substrate-binding protein
LVGVYSRQVSTAPGIRQLIDDNKLENLGCCSYVNVEALTVTRPDVVLTSFTTPDPAAPLFQQAGVKVIRTATIWEPSILARAEWAKLLGLLLNREADLEARFQRVSDRYEALKMRAAAPPKKPLVLFGYPSRGRWVASWEFQRLVKDAGGIVFGPRQPEDVPVNMQMDISFEEALARGRDAPIWVFLPDFVGSFDALLALEQRLSSFRAVRTQAVYDICNRCVAGRDSPYWSEYLANPDTVLADLVHILHPSLLPEHALVHMRQAPQSRR